jgi:hypothetical protein
LSKGNGSTISERRANGRARVGHGPTIDEPLSQLSCHSSVQV